MWLSNHENQPDNLPDILKTNLVLFGPIFYTLLLVVPMSLKRQVPCVSSGEFCCKIDDNLNLNLFWPDLGPIVKNVWRKWPKPYNEDANENVNDNANTNTNTNTNTNNNTNTNTNIKNDNNKTKEKNWILTYFPSFWAILLCTWKPNMGKVL